MNDYMTARLQDIASVQTGPFGSQLHKKDYVDIGTPIITVEHLGDNTILHQNLPCVSNEDRERLSKYQLLEGDIVFSRVGSVDRCAYVKKEEEGWLFSGRCLRIRVDPQQINPRYLSFYFGHPSFKAYIRQIAVGATMPSLNTSLMGELEIPLPPLPIQKKIASTLSSLDDKIELNTRMNKVLEEIARALFHRWFVEFEFPDANGRPYKSAGGKMVESEMGSVPEGWKVGTLEQIIELSYGKPLKKGNRTGDGYPVFGSNGVVGWHKEWLVTGPGIIVGRKGNPGTVTWSSENFFPIDTTFYVIPRSGTYALSYLYYLLKTLNLPHLSADSAVPGLNRNAALKQKILIPDAYTINKYEIVASSLFSLIHSSELENRTLITIRETLLPKLMSGEIHPTETLCSCNNNSNRKENVGA